MERLLERWARATARVPLVIVVAWIVLVLAALHFGPSLEAVAETQHTSALPASAASMRAEQLYQAKFAAGQRQGSNESDVLIYANPRGITSDDVAAVEHIEAWLTSPATRPAHLVSVAGPGLQAPATAFESHDGQALQVILTWDSENDQALQQPIATIDSYLAAQHVASGITVGVVGAAAVSHDLLADAFSSAGVGTLIGLLIILLVLGYVYRSPVAVVVPLLTIGMAFGLALPVIAWCGQTFGLPVETFSLQYVLFVLLGAGTNYGVFMLSRYREEIQRGADDGKAGRRAALGRAVGRVGEAIGSSAATVIVATGIMGLAQLDLLRVTGPAVAVAVACLLLAGLTLLPALMALSGRALFWPALPRAGTLAGDAVPQRGLWSAAGRLVTRHPLATTLTMLALLVPLAISAVRISPDFDLLRALPAKAPSTQAYAAYHTHFSNISRIEVLVSAPESDLRTDHYASALAQVAGALAHVPHVSAVRGPTSPDGQPIAVGTALSANQQAQYFATDGSAARFVLELDVDDASPTAVGTVNAAYAAVASTTRGTPLAGAAAYIRGQASVTRDEGIQLGADFRLVAALVSVAIYMILALLLRSLVAPLYLLATIALSAGTAIGATNLLFHDVLGQPFFYIVPIFAFVFLVALGEDFNILTMVRIREEVGRLGHRQGIAAAIALSGGVVSSCGLVMAASFARLASNPVEMLAQSGFAIVVGVLVDTFLVRPLLVPAIATLLGRWNWTWPRRRLGHLAPAPTPASQRGWR